MQKYWLIPNFGTFGFANVLDPWIAAKQDLESTLDKDTLPALVKETKEAKIKQIRHWLKKKKISVNPMYSSV